MRTENHFSKFVMIILLAGALFGSACSTQPQSNQNGNQGAAQPPAPAQPAPAQPSGKQRVAVMETSLGTIRFDLLEADAPKTAENFIKLAEKGFYNGLIFHRVIPNFMIQGGDPKGDGTGGQTFDGNPLPNEIKPNSPVYQRGGYLRGYVAMANKGIPQTATSQFFIMHKDRPFSNLQMNYTVFGRVTSGIEVVDKIAAVQTGAADRPVTPVVMKKVTIEEAK